MIANEDGHTREKQVEETPARPRLTRAAAEALDRLYERVEADFQRRQAAHLAAEAGTARRDADDAATDQKGA